MNTLELLLSDGVTLTVPASLQSITTYVLLEQESWFEKEMKFLRHWLRSGMTVIDIGANLGVYSLPMARLVGQTGHVFAYEPGSETRALLERSRELNAAVNLHISPVALSDCEREGRLVFGGSSELNALGDSGAGETVCITNLDSEEAARGWPSPDFIKIDAEGEEERILSGGRNFFARHSPLIMFEIKAGAKVNEQLRALFPAIGYRLFRQLGGAPILVPDDAQQPLDGFELNLFAAKPDRVSALSQQGFLVDTIPAWVPTEDDCKKADAFWLSQKFAPLINMSGGNSASADFDYRNSLAAYATWRTVDQPFATRCAALAFALRGLRGACGRAPTAERLSTLARVAWEWGARGESVAVLQRLLQILQSGQTRLGESFWPASARFDSIAPGSQPANWFVGAAAEQFETTFSFSSIFGGASSILAWLCSQPFASAEMERRRVLLAARAGQLPKVPLRLCVAAVDHLNANVWRAGKVPGTIVGMMPPKAQPNDFLGRFREVISDPLNLLIERVPMAGIVEANEVHLHNGLRVPVAGAGAYYGPFSQLLVINRGVHEPLEEYVFQEILKTLPEAPMMLELGAYWGHYSMWLKKLRPRSTVILVEPEQNNLAAGVKNFSRNGFVGEFIQSFVGRGHLEVDSFLKHRSLTHLNILHVDIQGYELEMLEGCQNSLSEQMIDYLFISTHSQEIHKGIVNKLNDLGYRVEVASDFDYDTTSFDGFVFASSPRAIQVFRNFGVMGRMKIVESRPQELLNGLLDIQRCNAATQCE